MKITGTFLKLFMIAALLAGSMSTQAQTKKFRFVNGRWVEVEVVSQPVDTVKHLVVDSLLDVRSKVFPTYFYSPVIFDSYDMTLTPDSLSVTMTDLTAGTAVSTTGDDVAMQWVRDRIDLDRRFRQFKQNYMIANPQLVKYNINTLPEAPKQYIGVVDPATAKITIEEFSIAANEAEASVKPVDIKKRHWLHDFNGLVQFSQAYNSPNWYQGGNNNLNMIVNAVYNVKLNQAFHPNLMFDNTIQYKLAMNSAPDDSLRNYSISEDLFQINSKFGVKAAKRWYYSATLQFKTQLLNNYKTNTYDLTAAFLSPGELNVGVGMTYNYVTPSKKFSFDASIAPVSYNMKISINDKINETNFGIKPGRNTVSQVGSGVDCKLVWNLAYNINFTSQLHAFTDYSYLQGDLENTLSFTINRFLSTQIYVHLRYDSTTPRMEDTEWHKWQLKEILSFGFSYKIGTV